MHTWLVWFLRAPHQVIFEWICDLTMSADLQYDYKAALKRLNLKKSDVEELREKIKKLDNVPKSLSSRKVKLKIYFPSRQCLKSSPPSIQLLCFLSSCSGIEEALTVIATYYEIRQACPSIFSNRDPLSAEIQQCLSNQHYFHTPNTPGGHSVIYHCLSNPKASNYVFDEACKTFFMTIGCLKLLSWSYWEIIDSHHFNMKSCPTQKLWRSKVESENLLMTQQTFCDATYKFPKASE